MPPIEFAVRTILAVFTLFFLFNWFLRKRQYRGTMLFDARERIAFKAAPWVVLVWTAFLILFLFINFSKFALLVIFPLAYLIVNQQVEKNRKRGIRFIVSICCATNLRYPVFSFSQSGSIAVESRIQNW